MRLTMQLPYCHCFLSHGRSKLPYLWLLHKARKGESIIKSKNELSQFHGTSILFEFRMSGYSHPNNLFQQVGVISRVYFWWVLEDVKLSALRELFWSVCVYPDLTSSPAVSCQYFLNSTPFSGIKLNFESRENMTLLSSFKRCSF